jgi:transcription-repair coupling factor (superfamily II helicase)
MVPGTSGISDIAKKRLTAIEELSGLGAGFRLAARDMEIRGAGNLLGPEQSGNIDAVGFETYCEMIESAIKELKGEKPEEKFESRFDIPLTGRITPEYVPSINQRMELYERLYEAGSGIEIDDLVLEIKDRFGPIPETMEKLILSIRLKNICAKLAIEKVDIIRDRLILRFSEKTRLAPDKMVVTAEKTGTGFRFTSGVSAEIIMEKDGWRNRYESVYKFLRSLQESI